MVSTAISKKPEKKAIDLVVDRTDSVSTNKNVCLLRMSQGVSKRRGLSATQAGRLGKGRQ